ncbi:ATP-binding cassette domain-containing protein [bacterium]|nr:ATP-binding cassette domain-containing protein [bacterium]
MLRVENIVVRYGNISALADVSHQFEPGSIYALTGPNGSGKSTLLKVIAGLLKPDSGKVLLRENDITDIVSPDIGILLQRPVLLAGSVSSNIEYGLKCHGIIKAVHKQRIQEALQAVGSEDLLKRPRHKLSGGEIQRVALARILALEPGILLLDERFSHLDKQAAKNLQTILMKLRNNGILLIMTTHNETLGYALGAEVIALSHGSEVLPEIRNVFRGISFRENNRWMVRLNSGHILEHTDEVEGEAAFNIDPGAVIITSSPVTTSARNSLPGKITGLIRENGKIRADIDCGFPVTVYLTDTSIQELKLSIDSDVFVVFKASALRICGING